MTGETKVLKPLLDRKDIGKLIEMNGRIAEANCMLLKAIGAPAFYSANLNNADLKRILKSA